MSTSKYELIIFAAHRYSCIINFIFILCIWNQTPPNSISFWNVDYQMLIIITIGPNWALQQQASIICFKYYPIVYFVSWDVLMTWIAFIDCMCKIDFFQNSRLAFIFKVVNDVYWIFIYFQNFHPETLISKENRTMDTWHLFSLFQY